MKEGKLKTNVKVQKPSKAPVRPPDGEKKEDKNRQSYY
jgi:hypothetical protein